jgi:hypothetical protein
MMNSPYYFGPPVLGDLYISGFIAQKILKMKICSVCEQMITIERKDENNQPTLIKIKNRGALLTPSLDVQKIFTI